MPDPPAGAGASRKNREDTEVWFRRGDELEPEAEVDERPSRMRRYAPLLFAVMAAAGAVALAAQLAV